MSRHETTELDVLEYGGTGRSGKGTIVAHLAEQYEGMATEETGADYRAVTKALLVEGIIESDMARDTMSKLVSEVSEDRIADFTAGRPAIVSEFGFDSLYADDVSGTVSAVGRVPNVRKGVKAGFKQRVEKARDDSNIGTLLVDGRNLGPVVESTDNTRLVLRTFVSCIPLEAALREIDRKIQKGEPVGPGDLMIAMKKVGDRNREDTERDEDPVAADLTAIDYWGSSGAIVRTLEAHSEGNFGANFANLAREMLTRGFRGIIRIGIGQAAVREDRQIKFDTTDFRAHFDQPKDAMLEAAQIMFEEAMDESGVTLEPKKTA